MSGPETLCELAAAWLAAEDRSTRDPNRETEAIRLGLAYEASLAVASIEEQRLAWEEARQAQARTEMGSREWAAGRRVSELLRVEYMAARQSEGASPGVPSRAVAGEADDLPS
ncbi:MAG TPA: hypothetical protein VES19_14360 [Candidatus Limnocylindrales bacterium]|nr:hypothetical protein [Candidatus Limnocylindrales bacterium]